VSEPPPLFIGVGDPLRGDDGVGVWVAERLRLKGLETVARARDGAALITALDGCASAALIDATRGAGAPGALTVVDLAGTRLPVGLSPASSHLVGLAEGVEILRALGGLPRRLVFYGIEGAEFRLGAGLSPPIAQAARTLAARLARGRRRAR
jgi:hydrogenase maturation protease